MTPEREQMIRGLWRRAAKAWGETTGSRMRVPIPQKRLPFMPEDTATTTTNFETVEFVLERGIINGRRASRVVCEGIVLDQWLER